MSFNKLIWIFFIALSIQAQNKFDPTFNVGSGIAGGGLYTTTTQVIKIQPDKRVLVGGNFTTFNGTEARNIVRLMPHGAIDSSFDTGTGFNNLVYTVAVQNDGKIIVGGLFTNYNGTSVNRIARLNKNGTLDTTFNIGTGFSSGSVEKILINTDGTILVAGSFVNYNGNTAYRMLRLQSNGAFDPNFNTGGTGANSYIMDMELQSDGKIVIGGAFSTYNNVLQNKIARLNANGTLDTSFNNSENPGITAGGNVMDIAIQSTSKIVIGGFFTGVQGNTVNYLARLNPNGSFDTSFGYVGPNAAVISIEVATSNKLLVGGNFTTFDESPHGHLVYLNANGTPLGSLDGGSFGNGFNNNVYDIAFDPVTQNVYTGGVFSNFDGVTSAQGLCRIHTLETIDIPDPAFEQYLIAEGIDSNGVTGNVLYTDIHNVQSLLLNGSQYNINDLSGIEGFANLFSLQCYSLPMVIYDFRYNSKLDEMSVSGCNIPFIELNNQTILTFLNLQNNQLNELDLSNTLKLEDIYLDQNELTSLDLSILPNLENVGLGDNFFETLDFSNNPYVNIISLYDNFYLTTLDLRNGSSENIEALNTAGCESLHCIYVDNATMTLPSEWVLNPEANLVETESACAALSSDEWVANFNITLYPNPTFDLVSIDAQDLDVIKLTVYDQLGNMVQEESVCTRSINMSHLNSGMYYLLFETSKGLVSKKLVKK